MSNASKKVTIMSIFFIILMIAFTGFQMIITKLYEEEGETTIGPFRFFISNTMFIISTLFMGQIKISQKWQMVLGAFGYTLNYSTGIFSIGASEFVKYFLAAVGSIINGVSSNFLFVNCGKYVNNVCTHYDELDKRGYLYGLFSGLYTISTIIGAVVVTFGLDLLSHRNYFILVTGIVLFSAFFCIIFVADIKEKKDKNQENQSFKEGIVKTLRYYPKMKSVLGYMWIDGIIVALSFVTLLHLYKQSGDQKKDQIKAGIILFFFGFGCVIGGFLGGKLCDIISIKKAAFIGTYLYMLNCLFSIIVCSIDVFPLSVFVCFLWGFIYYYVQANQMVISSRLYNGATESFAVTKQFHMVSSLLYQVIMMFTHNSISIYYIMSTLFIFGFPSLYLLRDLPREKSLLEKQSLISDENCDKLLNKDENTDCFQPS